MPKAQKQSLAPKKVARTPTTGSTSGDIVTRLVLRTSAVQFSDPVLEEIGERAAGVAVAQAAVALGSAGDELYRIKDRAAGFVHNTRFERLFKEVLRVFRGAPPALNERARSVQIASLTQGPVTKVLIGQAVAVVFTELSRSGDDMRALFSWLANELTMTSGVLDRQTGGRTFHAAHQFVGEKVFDLVALLLVALLYRDDDVHVLKDKAKFLCSDTLLSEAIPDDHELLTGMKSTHTKVKHTKAVVGRRFGEHGLHGDRGVYNLLSLLLADAAGTLHRFRLSKSQNMVDYTNQLALPSSTCPSDDEDGFSEPSGDGEEQTVTPTAADTSRTTRTQRTLQELSDAAGQDNGVDDEEDEEDDGAGVQNEAVVGDEDSSPPRPLSNRRRMPHDRASAPRRQWKPLLSSPDASTSGAVDNGGSPAHSGGINDEDDRFSDIYGPVDDAQGMGGGAPSNNAQAEDAGVDGASEMDNTLTAPQTMQDPAPFIAQPASIASTPLSSPAHTRCSLAASPTSFNTDGMQPAQFVTPVRPALRFGTASGPLAFPTGGQAQASPVSAPQSPVQVSFHRHSERADVENVPVTAVAPASTPRSSRHGALAASPTRATRNVLQAPPQSTTPRPLRSRFPIGPLHTCAAPRASPNIPAPGFGAPPSSTREALAESTSTTVNTPGAAVPSQAGSSRVGTGNLTHHDAFGDDASQLGTSTARRSSREEGVFAGTSPFASAANSVRDECLPPKVMRALRRVADAEHDDGDARPAEAPEHGGSEQIHDGARPGPAENGALTRQLGEPLDSRPHALLPSALPKTFGSEGRVIPGATSAGPAQVSVNPSRHSLLRGLGIVDEEIQGSQAIASATLPLRLVHTSHTSRRVATTGRFLLREKHTSAAAHVLAVATESTSMDFDGHLVPADAGGSEVDEEGYAGDYEDDGGRDEGRHVSGAPRKRFRPMQEPLTMDEPSIQHISPWNGARGSALGRSDRSRFAPSPETPTRLAHVVLATPPSECGPLPTSWPDFSDPYIPPPPPVLKRKEMFVD